MGSLFLFMNRKRTYGKPILLDVDEPSSELSMMNNESESDLEIKPLLSLQIFEPDEKEMQKVLKKTAVAQTKIREKNMSSAIQTVHALSLLAPGIVSAMAYGTDEKEQSEVFIRWTEAIRKKSEIWCEQLEVKEEDKQWVIGSLERILAENPNLNGFSDIGFLKEVLEKVTPPPQREWTSLEVSISLAVLDAMGDIQKAQISYPLRRKDVERDLKDCVQMMLEVAQDGLLELVEKSSSSELRKVVFVHLVQNLGKGLAAIWESYGKNPRYNLKFRNASDEEIWNINHPDGLDLQPIYNDFHSFAMRLLRLSKMAKFET